MLSDAEKLERYKDAFLQAETHTVKKQNEKILALTKENEQLKAQLAVSPVLRIWRGLLRRMKLLLHIK